jgi:NlpC/P60 family
MSTAQAFVNQAIARLGKPYSETLDGGVGPDYYDCSGLVQTCAHAVGIACPRSSQEQDAFFAHVADPQFGYLVTFNVPRDGGAPPQHIGIWTGLEQMIEAPHTGEVVKYSSIPNEPGVEWVHSYLALPFTAPIPPPIVRPQETDMIARNTAGTGYWCVRANADIYAFGGAPYLGPLPKYSAQWGIGTPTNPVVGITDDGAGGYVLETDSGGAQPALYHIDSSGQYAS